jgi:hypothetical protein
MGLKMTEMKSLLIYVLGILFLLTNCSVDKELSPPLEKWEGWAFGFADYPLSQIYQYELTYGLAALPTPLDPRQIGLMISGNNHSDDLWMFVKKKIAGLKPNQKYELIFKVELASQYPENSVGIGGSPGASVYLKAGASLIEPDTTSGYTDSDFKIMNIDKGNQANGGQDMILLGNIGIAGNNFTYTLIERNNVSNPFVIQTDSKGEIWVIVGTDSGFEGVTEIYFNNIDIQIIEKF